MADTSCPRCDGPVDRDAETERTTGRWIEDASPLDAELPEDLRAALARFLGRDSGGTLGDLVVDVRRRTGGGPVTVEELCLSEDATEHRGTLDGETYHFACFYDAVILAALAEEPVDIRTRSPGGTVIEARATGTGDLTATPEEAVVSFGIDTRVEPPSGSGPSLEDGYAAICPYVKAFPNREAYERWAETVPAATVAMALAGAADVAAALVA